MKFLVVVTPPSIYQSAMPDLVSLSRVPLHSWGSFQLFDSVVFVGGFNGVGDVDFAFHARYPWGSVRLQSDFLSLVAGYSRSFYCDVLRHSCLFFPCAKGLQSSRGGYFAIAKQYHGKYSPYFLLLLYCDEEGFGGLSSLLSDRLSLVSAFPLNYLEEENK